MLRILLATSALALTTACATTELEPIDASAFVAAKPVEDRTDYPVEIVETAVALPLPGQMMPIGARVTTNADGSVTRTYTRTISRPSVSPAEAIRQGRTGALIEPSVDGYVNAIQVYPYTEGALYRLYASPGQVSDIALQPGEELVSVWQATRSAGSWAIRSPALETLPARMCWSNRFPPAFAPI